MSTSPEIRENQIKDFLQKSFPIGIEKFQPIEGDAGLRSYFRFNSDNKTYIFMDCPPTYCGVEPFVDIANYLTSQGFSAPEIFHSDIQRGFLIIEDFGILNLKTYINDASENLTQTTYESVVDLLVLLQNKTPPKNLKIYNNEMLLTELNLFINYYAPYVLKRNLTDEGIEEYKAIWQDILNQQAIFNDSLVLRDYHVENTMYLEKRHGLKKLGLLDFQDAVIGSPIYDLVSILEDARIEVPRELALSLVKRFTEQKNLDSDLVLKNYHILGAQRNSRILGVFVRKFIRDQNDNYLKYIPLVRKYLSYDLSHPVMSKLSYFLNKVSL